MIAAVPSVTVIIPTYNWSSVLPCSIGSVLNQTIADFEVLVVGDGCTDDSEKVVANIGDARVRWINLPVNSGHQSAPNNEGQRQAKGEMIAYLGHDDLWLPHHLACLMEAIRKGADLAYGSSVLIGQGGERIDVAPQRAEYSPGLQIAPSNLLHRRAVTLKIGEWKNYRELDIDPETDLWQRAHAAGFRFSFVPRLVTVKFPAGSRRDAYRIRSNAEQVTWLARIKAEADFEAIEQTLLLYAAKEGRIRATKPYGPLLRDFLAETGRRIRHRLNSYKFRLAGKGSRIDAYRRHKGLGPTGPRE
jgi:glycosyltransferase involved in cell wall biosynthesis